MTHPARAAGHTMNGVALGLATRAASLAAVLGPCGHLFRSRSLAFLPPLLPTSATCPGTATAPAPFPLGPGARSEEHTSELQSLMRISYAVFCLKKKKPQIIYKHGHVTHNKTKAQQINKLNT